MDHASIQRVVRQHLKTDQLLGIWAVPVGQPDSLSVRCNRPGSQSQTFFQESMMPQSQSSNSFTGEEMELVIQDRDEKIRMLERIDNEEVKGCTKCGLCQGRNKTVFGEGDPDASIMFIGEGPGQSEDEQGRPFVGRAGELLTRQIEAMGFRRDQVYIGNVVKCRPPNNRTPTPVEVNTCWDYLRRQIQIIRPSVIITLGGPATKMVLQTRDGITRIRGSWYQYDGITPPIPVMPTFHPAYLLRSYTTDNRKKVWSDLQAVMKRLKACKA